MSWTEERIDRLKAMWTKGATASQIAEELGGVSRNAVIGKAHRLGLKARPSPVKPTDKPDCPPPPAAKPAKTAAEAPRTVQPAAQRPAPAASAPRQSAPAPQAAPAAAPAAQQAGQSQQPQ